MKCHILIVDDNEALRRDFPLWFREYAVTAAASAEEALKLLAGPHDIDLVLLDVQLPGLGGLEALQRIKARKPAPKVVIMTGFSSKDTAIHALAAHADNYIEKPFELAAMRAVIEKELADSMPPPDRLDDEGKIEHVMAYLDRNRFEKVTLRDAAATVGLTPKYLSRLFRRLAGCGFEEYKLRVKMREARAMLRSHENSVKQVAHELGYANTESFIRQFKKIEGQLPSDYRAGHKPPVRLPAAARRKTPKRP